jgi:hypothetical protein
MILLIAILLAVFVLPSPWNVVAMLSAVCSRSEVVVLGNGRSDGRRAKPTTG